MPLRLLRRSTWFWGSSATRCLRAASAWCSAMIWAMGDCSRAAATVVGSIGAGAPLTGLGARRGQRLIGPVPPPPDQLKDATVARATRSRSVIEWTSRPASSAQSGMSSPSFRELSLLDLMVQFSQEGLVLWLPPAKLIDADLVPVQVHLHSHQPIQPVRVHLEDPAQHPHRPRRTGPPQVHDPAPGSRLEIQSPSLREGPPPGGRLDAIGSVAAEGGHVPLRVPLQARQ